MSLRPSVRSNAPGLAAERPRDHAPDGVLALHDLARHRAGGVELGGRDLVDVRGDLQHRVGGGVDDQVPRLQVLLAEVVDHGGAAVGLVAEHAAAGAVDQLLDDLLREAVGVGAQRHGRDRAHQLPVAGDRVLARALRVQPAVDDRVAARAARRRAAAPSRARAPPSPARRARRPTSATWPSVFAPRRRTRRSREARPPRRRRARSRRRAGSRPRFYEWLSVCARGWASK